VSFAVDPSIEAVTAPLLPLPLCEARLMDDARFLWVVLIPRRPDLVELDDLGPAERTVLLEEAVKSGEILRRIGQSLGRPVEKLNTAALGNVTRQLHVHVIGRRTDDAAWPRPVWGQGEAEPWPAEEIERVRALWADRA
jgi:diadenosine tetraphosphate (Ap4A) HIT family hydrolase